jgi:putative transposase
VKRFDTIYIEDLNLRGMVKNHNLARSLHDASIGMAVQQLEYKCTRYGKTVQKIDRWFPSSKLCSKCGHLLKSLSLDVREWKCPNCGTHHDRDENAAENIKAVGQTVSAHGEGVRAVKTSVLKANPLRSANLHAGFPRDGIPLL